MLDNDGIQSINQSTNQSIKFIILIAHCRLDFTINSSIQILKKLCIQRIQYTTYIQVYNSIQRVYNVRTTKEFYAELLWNTACGN